MIFGRCLRPSSSSASGSKVALLRFSRRTTRFSSTDATNVANSTSPGRVRQQRAERLQHADGTQWEFRAGWVARLTAASVVLSTREAGSTDDGGEDNAILCTVVSKCIEPSLSVDELLEEVDEEAISVERNLNDGRYEEEEEEGMSEEIQRSEEEEEAEMTSSSSRKKDGSTTNPFSNGLALTVDFRQSASAIGRIPSNYFRKELSNDEQQITISRIIDRSLRPTIPPHFPGRIHVVCKPLALDPDSGDSTVLGINVAAAALALSPVPLRCTTAAVRVGIVDGNVVLNPSREVLKRSTMDLVFAGTRQVDEDEPDTTNDARRVLMVEMEGKEVNTEQFVEAMHKGFDAVHKTHAAIQRLVKAVGSRKYEVPDPALTDDSLAELSERCEVCQGALEAIFTDFTHTKMSRAEAMDEIFEGWRMLMSRLPGHYSEAQLRTTFSQMAKKLHHQLVHETGRRIDGRAVDEFRPIECRVNLYKKLHGSALFQRGQSQVFSTVTFDSPQSAFHPDAIAQLLGAQRKKTFMLHYEFPQFATNEFEERGSFSNRREIGHGVLAEKALRQVMPEQFPYTVRLACQVLESNGSTSMASVCAGSMALFDAGVPLLANHVAGLAIGLLTDGEGKRTKYTLLTDLMGYEDYAGDMDFKIAGTQRGFTAMQMDIKICGLPFGVLRETLERGRKGIDHVLALMRATVAEPRSEFKTSVPIIETMPLPAFKRAVLFRSGGYKAKLLEAETGVKVNSEDDSNISLFAPDKECMRKGKEMLEKLLEEHHDEHYQFGAIYKADIVQIMEGGVMVALREGAQPIWMRNSDLSAFGRKNAIGLSLQVGQRINVQYFGRDQHTGQHRISCKTLQIIDPPVQNLFGRNAKVTSGSGGGSDNSTAAAADEMPSGAKSAG
uniref:Polyribonucleotide nucleotidyltransferase n=1 Tax=Globodera rostochiensis TaxID=31243 RepID=A0A914I316_GLORO